MSCDVKGAPSCQVTPFRRLKSTRIFPSGTMEMVPASNEGTFSDSRPIRSRELGAAVISPSEWISVTWTQPPAGLLLGAIRLNATGGVEIATLSTLDVAAAADGAASVP